MNLLILSPDDKVDETTYTVSDVRAIHIREVLKSEVGDSVEVGLVNGKVGTAKILSIDNKAVRLVVAILDDPLPIIPTIDLICALPRPQTLKKVLATSACMGVRQIHLIRANRVEKSYFQSPLLEPENLDHYLIEGISQGKLTRLPTVEIHDRFKPFAQTLPERYGDEFDSITKLLPDMEAIVSLQSVCQKTVQHIVVAIGPEGGFVPFETDLFQTIGFAPISLGRWILRVENAVTAALSQIEMMTISQD